jgi:membrane-associated phospholipid phosphatase
MDGMLESGYDLIQWLQRFSPALDALFRAITTLGAEQVFLLLLPLIYWCVDKRQGARLGVLLALSAFLNHTLKSLFDQPRPSPYRVEHLAEETSPGWPSGHSQNALAVYGFLAAQVRRPWAWAVTGSLAFAVGLSRVYLGVHFPSDVLGGWFVGAVLLALYLQIEPQVEHRLRACPWGYKMVLAVALPLTLFLIYANESSAQLMGVLMGLTAGILIEERRVRFDSEGALRQRVTRFAVGGMILVAVWLGTRVVFSPLGSHSGALILRLMRYALVGAWASLGAPWLFVRAGLAPRADSTSASALVNDDDKDHHSNQPGHEPDHIGPA